MMKENVHSILVRREREKKLHESNDPISQLESVSGFFNQTEYFFSFFLS